MKNFKQLGALTIAASLIAPTAMAQDSWTEETLLEALAGPLTRSLTGCDRSEAIDPDAIDAATKRSANLSIEFEFGSAKVKEGGMVSLLGKSLSNPRLACHDFLLAGHTDAVGGDDQNLALSKARATALRAYLMEKYEVDAARLVIRGYGETDLKNKDDPNADENRRVEVITLTSKKSN